MTTCHVCGRTWPGHIGQRHAQAHCAGCCRHFSGITAFDIHQRTKRDGRGVICRDPATITDRDGSPRLTQVITRYGPSWAIPGTWAGPEREEVAS